MYMEAKALFTVIAAGLISIVLALQLSLNPIHSFLLLMGIVFIIIGDMVVGIKIYKNHLQPLIEPMQSNEELCVYFDFAGNMDFIKTYKGTDNTRSFKKYKKDATIVNKGDYPIRSINGNIGFIGHENYDKNVNILHAEALDKQEGDTIKDIYKRLTKREKNGTTN